MQMIQFVSILNFIQMKLIKICGNMKNKMNKKSQHFVDSQLIELQMVHLIGSRVIKAARR
jgi:hypothetical protein